MEELIKTGQMNRGKAVPVALLFAVFTVGTIAIDLVAPGGAGRAGHAAGAALAAQRAGASVSDGTWMKVAEGDLRQRSQVQRTAASTWSALLLELGREGNENVVVGERPWLFDRVRTEIPDAFQKRGPEIAGSYFAAISRRLESHGTRVAVAPLPRKAVVCAAQLPEGFDASPGVDARLLAAARARGALVIDLLEEWKSMPAAAVYQTTDTHWNVGGRTSFARAVKRAFPTLAVDGPSAPHTITEVPSATDLAGVLGIRGEGLGMRIIERPPTYYVNLDLAVLAASIDGTPGDGVLTVAGTSFSEFADLQPILSSVMGRHVTVRSLGGGMLGQTLTGMITELGLGGLPRQLVYEMPICLSIVAIDEFGGARRSMSETFWHLPPARATVLGAKQLGGVVHLGPASSEAKVIFPEGSLLSSGDGVLNLRLTVNEPATAHYFVRAGELSLFAETSADRASVTVPILDAGKPGADVLVTTIGPDFADIPVQIEVVCDCDLEQAHALQASPGPGAGARFAGDASIAPFATLVLEGSLNGPLLIEVEGVLEGGEAETLTQEFEHAASSTAFISVGRFAGGRIDHVRVTGPEIQSNISARLAPLARRGM